jgi:hypothetical protein
MKLYSVFFVNLDMTKHFDTEDEALDCAKDSGFECVIRDPEGFEVCHARFGVLF